MMLKREATGSPPSSWRKWMRAGAAALGAAAASMTLAAGCLDRPVVRQEPNTSNIYVAEIRQTAVDKIDLLFMIDNSISMADKQQILREAVPVLVRRLVTPVCIDGNGNATGQNSNSDGECPGGTDAEFTPIKDIHIAIVTSSLGAHGGDTICTGTGMGDPSENDRAYPLGLVRPTLASDPASSWAGTGFLAWDPDAATGNARNTPAGEANQGRFQTQFENMVAASGEIGCGFEASLEAWYRFLVDPEPPTSVGRGVGDEAGLTIAQYNPPDATLLELRNRFLRPDSLVAIIMLTDENDCSINDDRTQGWLVGTTSIGIETFRMPRSTSTCATDPNNQCCFSCSSAAPPGCAAPAGDASCMLGGYSGAEDNVNLRCFKQKERFGIDLLYPISRYVDALTKTTVLGRDGVTVKPNPLFANAQRDSSLVFLAGIVGVPWQDVATPESLGANAPLEYMTYDQLVMNNRFDWILGANGQPPLDALMFETPIDRSQLPFLNQMHPGTGDRVTAATAGPGPGPNSINGREMTIADGSDLQYACIFPLGTSRQNCTDTQNNCDCRPVDGQYNRPLCNGTTQTHAKAYPGTRHLQVLQGVGQLTQNAIIASICPKFSTPQSGALAGSYGYNPAVAAIIDRLKEALRGKCLPRKLAACNCDPTADPECGNREGDQVCRTGSVPGQVSCSVIEAKLPEQPGVCAPCAGQGGLPGRIEATDQVKSAVRVQLRDSNYCGTAGLQSCESFCFCEIQQFTGPELERCQREPTTPNNIYGYCYVDPSSALDDAGEAAADTIVAGCPATQRRLLRFTGDNVPAKGAVAMIACLGANIQEGEVTP